jgi:hypothetical protein
VAQCIDGVLVMFDTEQKGLSGVLVNNKKQAVRCVGQKPRSCSNNPHSRNIWNRIP